MTAFEYALVAITLAIIVVAAFVQAIAEKRAEERRRRRAIRRATFAAHRQTLAMRGMMIAAVEARRDFESSDFMKGVMKIAAIIPVPVEKYEDETGRKWPS